MSNVNVKKKRRTISESHAKISRICITCNSQSIENKQYRTTNSKSFQVHFTKGLCCSLCNSFVCYDCIHAFHSEINPIKHKEQYHPDMFPLIDAFSFFTSTVINESKKLNNYIGHCCFLKQKCKENSSNIFKKKH